MIRNPGPAAHRPNPLISAEVARPPGGRPAGTPPQPSAEPARVQRRASATGVSMVARQKAAVGRTTPGQTVTVLVTDTTLAVEFSDGETQVVNRTMTQPVRSIKGQRPQAATPVP